MVAVYSFSVRIRYPSRRVAFSTPTTRTPVAIGSRVPAWPTRLVPASRRIRATTSCDVIPPGLSTMTRPLGLLIRSSVGIVLVVEFVVLGGLAVGIRITGRDGTLPAAGQLGVRVLGLGDQFLDPMGVLRQHVGHEGQRGGVLQAELPADLGPDDASGE